MSQMVFNVRHLTSIPEMDAGAGVNLHPVIALHGDQVWALVGTLFQFQLTRSAFKDHP